MRGLAAAGVDFDDVTATLEREGVSAFSASFQDAVDTLEKKARELAQIVNRREDTHEVRPDHRVQDVAGPTTYRPRSTSSWRPPKGSVRPVTAWAGRTAIRPNTYFNIVEFPSYEVAMKNSRCRRHSTSPRR